MNEDLAARRRVKAEARVARDCQASLERVGQGVELDHVAALILGSLRRHPSNGRKPYDFEEET